MGRQTPYEGIVRELEPMIGDAAARLPKKWEILGDVVVVRLPADLRDPDMAATIGGAYAHVLGARIVLDDVGGIEGALRKPGVWRIFGDGPATTALKQDGITYHLDPERVMFSSGNIDERVRMGRVPAQGQTIVDLFAGIGYFTLPLLVHAGAKQAIACELNRDAARFLAQNGEANDVHDRLHVRLGDCRDVAPEGEADRVVSGWFPHGHRYLDVAFKALRPRGGVIHYHDTAKADDPDAELTAHAQSAADAAGRTIASTSCRVVKGYAPGVVHAVLDIEVRG